MKRPGPVLDRFWAKVAVSTPSACWEWTASLDGHGYGQFGLAPTMVKSHRFAYEITYGRIPEGLEIDHLCRNKACVNPVHLEPVTHRENVNRGVAAERRRAKFAAQTHCVHGHEYTEENTRWKPKNGYRCRACRTCERQRI